MTNTEAVRTRVRQLDLVLAGRAAEAAVLAMIAAGMGWFAFAHGGQVVGTDTLGYLDAGLRAIEDPFILNRYTHVFLLRLFTSLSASPINGMRAYSAFVAVTTTFLVYYAARILTPSSSPANGLIAVGLFLGIPRVLDAIIAPLVDTSAMLLMLAIIAAYITSARLSHSRRWLLVLFGLLFFMGVRTKETLVTAAVLVPGFMLMDDGKLISQAWVRRIALLAGGMAIGAVAYLLLNALFLGSPFFGLRPSDLVTYRALWSETVASSSVPGMSFNALVLAEMGIPFVLFLVAGLAARERFPLQIRILWLVPLSLVGVVIIFSTRQGWQIVPRGFLPGIAVVCVLASQIPDLSSMAKARIGRLAVAGLSTLSVLSGLAAVGLASRGEVPFPSFYQAAFAPITLVLILAVVLVARRGPEFQLAAALLLLPISLYPVRVNLVKTAEVPQLLRLNVRFEPILAFEERLHNVDELSMFVSDSLMPRLSIGENRDELAALVNVALDVRTDRSDYTIATPDEALVRSLIDGDYDYVLLVDSEWDWLRTAPQDQPAWRRRYTGIVEPNGRYVLLVRNDASARS